MKILKSKAAYILLLLLPLFSLTATDPEEQFSHYKTVTTEGNGEYSALFLDSDIYKYARQYLQDLRIYDSEGKSVPYYLEGSSETVKEEKESYPAKQFYKESDKKQKWTLQDFQIYAIEGKESEVKTNMLTLTMNEEEYSRQIELYGRHKESGWQLIKRDTIYRMGELKREEINFSTSNYLFYRVKLLNSNEELKVVGAELSYSSVRKERELYQRELSLEYDLTTDKNNASWVTIKNSNRLKLTNINLEVTGNFNREIMLYQEYQSDEGPKLNYLGASRIYNLEFKTNMLAQKELELSQYGNSSQVLKIKVNNGDDHPLEIKGVRVTYLIDRLIFKENEKGPYRAYFGNKELQSPDYDISSYRSYIEQEELNSGLLGPLVTLKEAKEPVKLPIDSKTIFNIVIGLVSIVLIALLLMALRKKSS